MSTKEIKILSLSTSDSKGGASIAAYRIHNALNKFPNNFFSLLLVARKYTLDNKVISYYPLSLKLLYFIKLFISRKIQSLQKSINPIVHSGNYFPSFIHKYINKSNCDIVHIHWVQDEFLPISSIIKINKPIIWTLHDSWAFCGTEHHPLDLNDNRYKEGYYKYNRNNQNNSFIKLFNPDLDRFNWSKKKLLMSKKINFIAPSKWMKNCLKDSYLFSNNYCEIIPNPVPDIFYSMKNISKKKARLKFNFPINKPILLFIANRANKDINKGWHLIKDILFDISKSFDFHLLIIGGECDVKLYKKSSLQIIERIESPHQLALIYKSVSLLLLPSLIETLPQVATECITTGTPVIAFKGSGIEDVVINNITGFLVERFNKRNFYESLLFFLRNCENKFDNSCYNYSLNNWKEKIIVSKYRHLYENILSNQS